MMTSGGSPASRERAMRSCTMLKASTITRRDAGAVVAAAEDLALQQLLHGAAVAGDAGRLVLRRLGLGCLRHGASMWGTTVPRPHESELTLTAIT